MFIGHYAPALIAARSRRAPSLFTMVIAVQLVDIAFFSFALLGIEHFRLVPGATASNWLDLYDMPYTHSLLGSAGFAIAFAALVWLIMRRLDAALIAAAMVLSHWLVDLLVHRPDLTLAGSPPLLGFGLWNMPFIEKPLELALAFGALAAYAQAARPTSPRAMLALGAFGGALALTQSIDWFGPRTTEVSAGQPITALFAYALIAALALGLQSTRAIGSRAL